MSNWMAEKGDSAHLQEEIDMLRVVIRQAFQIVQALDDPAEKLRGLNAIGTAATRMANLIKTQHQLGGDADSEIARAIDYAIREAAKRMNVEL